VITGISDYLFADKLCRWYYMFIFSDYLRRFKVGFSFEFAHVPLVLNFQLFFFSLQA